jgi:ribosome-associated protein
MRDVDPEPIRAQFARWDGSSAQETARLHNLERRREQLLTEPQALDALCAQYPTLDRPHWRNLIQRAKEEQANGLPPKSYRQIFRELRELAGEASDTPGQDNPES